MLTFLETDWSIYEVKRMARYASFIVEKADVIIMLFQMPDSHASEVVLDKQASTRRVYKPTITRLESDAATEEKLVERVLGYSLLGYALTKCRYGLTVEQFNAHAGRKTIKQAVMRVPAKLEARQCWIGSYTGHFSVVVVFSQMPKMLDEAYWLNDNTAITAGTFDLEEFNAWFGTDIKATTTEILTVEEYMLTGIWTLHNTLAGLHTNFD